MNKEDPLLGILSTVMFAIKAIFNTALEVIPTQLGFCQSTILPIFNQGDWQFIKAKKNSEHQ